MNRRIEITAIVEVVTGSKAAAHHFIALIYDTFVEVASEPGVQEAVATAELAFHSDRIIGESRIFGI